MKSHIDYIDLFSGINGFSLGLERAGFTFNNHYYSENDKEAIANTKYNYPSAKLLGSVADVPGSGVKADIITFGSPCQDFSVAGNREGLEGSQSILIMEAIRIISELRPAVFIWENVKGTFSSNNGEDFWAILNAFANIGGYRLEWQLLNTKWFLPQNRERIYLIGHLAGKSEPKVFPISQDDSVFAQKSSRQNGQSLPQYSATTITQKEGMRADSTFIDVPPVAGALCGGGHSGGLHSQMTTISHKHGLRRLTEIETERLHGFPDDWTKYGNYNGIIKEISMTQRFKMTGNAVSPVVVQEVGKRLLTTN